MEEKEYKLLIVEDEPDVCASINSYFDKRGFFISTTDSGKHALLMIESIKPDLVILDISLKELNGIEVLNQLRSDDKKTKVIILTGYLNDQETINKIKRLGVSAYENKPMDLKELEQLINQTLGIEPYWENKHRINKKEEKYETGSIKNIIHSMSNILTIIRTKSESFTSNIEDGKYRDKSQEELISLSISIMNDNVKNIDLAVEIMDKMTGFSEQTQEKEFK